MRLHPYNQNFDPELERKRKELLDRSIDTLWDIADIIADDELSDVDALCAIVRAMERFWQLHYIPSQESSWQ